MSEAEDIESGHLSAAEPHLAQPGAPSGGKGVAGDSTMQSAPF